MIEELLIFIKTNFLFYKKDKLLVAMSGGIDSIVLCTLLHQAGFKIAIAHCNFQLRGKESDEDEKFVQEFAEKLKIPFFVQRFETQAYTKENGISIQMAARDLRYTWFEQLRLQQHYDYIAVAHHQDDEIETFFINLIRGTGITGLHGIMPKTGKIVRPLLFAGRKEIKEFAKKNKINYREDSSNSSTKYMRNRIRLQLLPMLKEMNPDIENAVGNAIHSIRQIQIAFHYIFEMDKNEIIKEQGDIIMLDIDSLMLLKHRVIFLYEFLKEYHFKGDVIEKIANGITANPGKQYFSSTHRLVKDRKYLILSPIPINETAEQFSIPESKKSIDNPVHLTFKTFAISEGFEVSKDKNTATFDYDKLSFPLTIRKWEKGDYFYPFGMKGKKKLSDFFTDLKLSLNEKEDVWLLCNKDDIIWVIGHRIDNRYKVSNKTTKVFTAIF